VKYIFTEACESYLSGDSCKPTNVWGQRTLRYIYITLCSNFYSGLTK